MQEGLAKKLYIKTYGCQMNVYDSIKMEELLEPYGFVITENVTEAQVVILNTCHIREKAAQKVYSELGRIQKAIEKQNTTKKEKTVIVVAGCVGQAEGEEIFQRAPYVDIVVGPQSYHNLPQLLARLARSEKHLISLDFIEEKKFDNLPIPQKTQGASSFISIQEGCDKFCTFCVVPYTRGAEFSRNVEEIYRDVLIASNNGSKEIYLLGQNVNAYHGKGPQGETYNLARLIDKIAQIEAVERIRYTTSHPIDMCDELIEIHGSEKKLMPCLHLPVQSGSNAVLKAMNRKHTKEEYLTIIDKLRAKCPEIAFTSDFIVGFPGETDDDFAETLELVRTVGYATSFSFKYSPRPGTPATSKPQIADDIKNTRLQILQAEIISQQIAFNNSCVGKIMPVLFEKTGKFDNQIIGKTPYLQSIIVENGTKELIGQITNVKIAEAKQVTLHGDVMQKEFLL